MTGRFSPAGGDSDPRAARTGRRRRPRWRRWLVGIALGLVGLISAAVLLLQISPVSTHLVNTVLARVHVARSALQVDRVQGNWLASIELHGFRMTRGDTVVVAVDTLRARYSLRSLLANRIVVRDLGVAGVVVSTYPTGAKPATATPSPPAAPADFLRGGFYKGRAIQVDRVDLRDARFDVVSSDSATGLRVERIRLRADGMR